MNKLIPLAAATLAATALTGAANANQASDLDAFKARYGCHDVRPGDWSEAADLLTRPRGVKTTLFVLPGEQTVMVRKGTNKASVAAVTAYGQVRLVCERLVPWAQKPELGS